MVPDSHVTVLSDGRELGWLELGDPAGSPVLAFHGTPGSRRQLLVSDEWVRAFGVRLICLDRPGYGLSTFQPGRRLADWPADVVQLADHLDVDRFAVVGISGGGPHAAVCAAALPHRVTSAAIVSGVGPLSDPRAAEEMMPLNRMLTRLAGRRSRILRAVMALQVTVARRWPSQALSLMAKSLPAADVAILERPDVRSMFLADVERSSRTAARAAAQDLELFAADWGVDLGATTVPVHVWQGDADVNVPPHHARILHDAIPGSELHWFEGEGHFMVLDHLEEVCRALLAGQPAKRAR